MANDGGEGGSSGAAGLSAVSEVAVPDQYMCSITAEIMTDPVSTTTLGLPPRGLPCTHTSPPLPVERAIQADGFTYERCAIEQWLKTHNTSPATGLELESKQLNPNYSLRSLIRDLGHEAGV
eukprot:scaffold18468_cov48-Phaeocystis_antarctica.AAC.2